MSEDFLLDCSNYQAYLDHYVTAADMRYLRNNPRAREIVRLNFRSTVKIYTREEFQRRKKQVYQQYFPEIRKTLLFSWGMKSTDVVLKELAEREKPNQQKTLSTIIHIRYVNKHGFEMSGFIDYAYSLQQANLQMKDFINWSAVFNECLTLRPRPTDLSYFDWHKNMTFFNETPNYVILHDVKGLIFMHRGDHKKLCVADQTEKHELLLNGYSRLTLRSDRYGHVMLFDHIVRKKI